MSRLLAALLVFASGAVHAACTVTAPNLAFGAYDPLGAAPTTTSASTVVTCNEAPPPTVTLEIGASGVSGGFFPRQMQRLGGTDRLSYNLYVDPGTTSVWGDGSGGTATRSAKVTKNKPWSVTVYGRVPAGQDVAAGSYSDMLTLTINF